MTDLFATIGHSHRPRQVTIEMLREAGVRMVVDVRSFPKSRSNPDFNQDVFPGALASPQIGYLHMLDLGGRRPNQPDIDEATNALWGVRGFAITPTMP